MTRGRWRARCRWPQRNAGETGGGARPSPCPPGRRTGRANVRHAAKGRACASEATRRALGSAVGARSALRRRSGARRAGGPLRRAPRCAASPARVRSGTKRFGLNPITNPKSPQIPTITRCSEAELPSQPQPIKPGRAPATAPRFRIVFSYSRGQGARRAARGTRV